MNGYFRARHTDAIAEVRRLNFSDLEFVPEDELDVAVTLNWKQHSHGYSFVCPRCESRNRATGMHPYCSDCNWDSLTDSDWNKQCAA